MTLVELVVLFLIAGVCGSLGQSLAGYSHGGCLVSIVLGFIGALLGSWLSRMLGLPEPFSVVVGTEVFPVLWSIIGAALFVAVIRFLGQSSRTGT